MPPKSVVLEMQTTRKNTINQLVECIDKLGKVIEDKDRRIVQLQDFISSIYQIAKDTPEQKSNPSNHQRLFSISFKEDTRRKNLFGTHMSSENFSIPETQQLIENVNSLHKENRPPTSEPSSMEIKQLATTRMTQM